LGGTAKTCNLGLKIVALPCGRPAMTIADLLGKSDRVVRRDLREAKAAGLLEKAA